MTGANLDAGGVNSTGSAGSSGTTSVFGAAMMAMYNSYKLNSMLASDMIKDIESKNDKIKGLIEDKKFVKQLAQNHERAISVNGGVGYTPHDNYNAESAGSTRSANGPNGRVNHQFNFTGDAEVGARNREYYAGYSAITDPKKQADFKEEQLSLIDDQIDIESSNNQLDMIRLQNFINNLNLLVTMMTQLLKTVNDANSQVARNI